ncbi:MAG: hypothetical protein ABI565_14635 [Vicinamibacteria bacterium]
MPADLPFIDEFDVKIEASAPAVYEALTRHLGRSLGTASARMGARLLGCVHRAATYVAPPVVGQETNGFVVAEVKDPTRLVLEGRHRFARYRLSFLIDPLTTNLTRLTARTDASFPGVVGAVYRALVIGSGGHQIVARRMLAAVAARAERMEPAK